MERHWLTRPETIRKLWWIFGVVLALAVVAGLLAGHEGHFGIDSIVAFDAWFGFLACAALIAVAKGIGAFLKRPDTYYEERDD